ncbi:unnamed protein product [Linum tenue]|uniref:Uncharacterized protein n=1 Tax=Linum tenue TaxID=586396 RepID=A0AAV0K2G3_9ROSI|nr:unnamed protein product [Linum tenue]
MAAPSGASGRESSIVAEIVEVEENSTDYMQTLRRPPVITIHRSPAYAIYQLIHNIRDVAYRPVRVFCQDAKMRARCVEGMCKACGRMRLVMLLSIQSHYVVLLVAVGSLFLELVRGQLDLVFKLK